MELKAEPIAESLPSGGEEEHPRATAGVRRPKRRLSPATVLRRRRQSLRVWARATVEARLKRLTLELGRLESTPNAETIHNTRVASRRLRATLRHLEPCFRALQVERLRAEIRHVARQLGVVRDLDILMGNLAVDARRARSPLAFLMERLRSRREATLRHALPAARQLRMRLPAWLRRLVT